MPLVLGTDSGNYGTFHGAAVHREMELWQDAGIPPKDILKAATGNAAKLLRAEDRIGKFAKGFEASLVIVDAIPSKTFAARAVFPTSSSKANACGDPPCFRTSRGAAADCSHG